MGAPIRWHSRQKVYGPGKTRCPELRHSELALTYDAMAQAIMTTVVLVHLRVTTRCPITFMVPRVAQTQQLYRTSTTLVHSAQQQRDRLLTSARVVVFSQATVCFSWSISVCHAGVVPWRAWCPVSLTHQLYSTQQQRDAPSARGVVLTVFRQAGAR